MNEKTIEFLKTKGLIKFDMSAIKNIKLNKGYEFSHYDRKLGSINYQLCKCGFEIKKIKKSKDKYADYRANYCPLCKNHQFLSINKKNKDADNNLLEFEDENDLLLRGLGSIKMKFEDEFFFDLDKKEFSLITLDIRFFINFVEKKIDVLEKNESIIKFKYVKDKWFKINPETDEFYEEQSFANLPMMLLSKSNTIRKEKQQELMIPSFLEFYNQIVPKEEQIHSFNGIDLRAIGVSMLSRNGYILSEFFDRNLVDINLYYYNEFQLCLKQNEAKMNYSMAFLSKYFPFVSLDSFTQETKELHFSEYFRETYGFESIENNKRKHSNVFQLIDLPKTLLLEIKKFFNENEFPKKKSSFTFFIRFINNTYKLHHENKINLESIKKLINLLGLNMEYYPLVVSLMRYHPTKKVEKIAEYFLNLESKKLFSFKTGVSFYNDYINMSNELEIEFNIFPKNLRKVHDVRVNDYNAYKMERESKSFELIYTDYEEVMDINDDYAMVKPLNTHDLIKEGQNLNHCVGSYANAVMSKRSLIFFLRKKDNISKALVTVELNPNKLNVVQQKGKYNRAVTSSENEAIKLWVKTFIKNKVLTSC